MNIGNSLSLMEFRIFCVDTASHEFLIHALTFKKFGGLGFPFLVYSTSEEILQELIVGGGLKSSVKTRWNTAWDCCKSVLHLETVFKNVS